jgi:D-alanine-D-alanine ligase
MSTAGAGDDRPVVLLLFGGRSGEHDVSCASALSVLRGIDVECWRVVPVGITRAGRFVLPPPDAVAAAVASHDDSTAIAEHLTAEGDTVHLVADDPPGRVRVIADDATVRAVADVVFPVLHGPYGEDGTIQGMLDVLRVPYVGSGVLGSSVAMDKVATKRVLAAEGLAQVAWRSRTAWEWEAAPDPEVLVAELGLPCFVKPANLGSSVGVSKVGDTAALPAAMAEAFRHDHVVIVEAGVDAREIEVGVLGGTAPGASVPGEVVAPGGFYDFALKYTDEGATTIVPAELPGDVADTVRDTAVRVFAAVGAWGLARVDFFVTADGSVLVNEINTMPGFTSISMFTKMWEASGVPYAQQVEQLLQLAFERAALQERRSN